MANDLDTTAIRASALRIIELAQGLPRNKRRDFEVEAAAILTLISAKGSKDKNDA